MAKRPERARLREDLTSQRGPGFSGGLFFSSDLQDQARTGDKGYRREQPLSLISPTSGKRPVMKNALVIVRFTVLCGITSTKCVLKELVAHPVDYVKDMVVYQARLGAKTVEAYIDLAKGDDSTFDDLVKQLTREDGPEFITPSIQRVVQNYHTEMKPAIEALAAL